MELIRSYRPAGAATSSSEATRPILITGSHRSGTTWVGHTLAKAPGIGYISEPFNPYHRPGILGSRFPEYFAYIPTDPDGSLAANVQRMLEFRYGTVAELRSLRSARDVGRMIRDAARCRTLRAAHARPLVKDPIALLAAPWLADTFDMQVVVLIRHPAAFASSLKRMGWAHDFSHFRQPGLLEGPLAPFADEIEDFARRQRPVIEQAALLWSALNHVVARYRHDHPDWTFVRHEDLSVAPHEEFEQLFGHLDVPFDSTIRAYLDAHTAGSNPAEAETGRAHQLKRDSKANVKSWRSRLTPEEIELVRERTAAVAVSFYGDEDW